MEEAKKNLMETLVETKLDYPYKYAHNFNIDSELMVEITLDEYRTLVAANAKLEAELDFLKGRGKNGAIS